MLFTAAMAHTSPHDEKVGEKDPDTGLHVEDGIKKPVEPTDYAGAHEKHDPAEIKLVRKLDWHIMPMLWFMYWLNYLV